MELFLSGSGKLCELLPCHTCSRAQIQPVAPLLPRVRGNMVRSDRVHNVTDHGDTGTWVQVNVDGLVECSVRVVQLDPVVRIASRPEDVNTAHIQAVPNCEAGPVH